MIKTSTTKLRLLTCIILFFLSSSIPFVSQSGIAQAQHLKGTWNKDITWELDTVTGELNIRGTGTIEGTYWSDKKGKWIDSPWKPYLSNIKHIIIAPGAKRIERYCFQRCEQLVDVLLPDGLEEIGESAFYDCKKLVNIEFPTSLKTLETNAFSYCESLKEIDIPKGVTEIQRGAFANCSSLEKITLHEGLKIIGSEAFSKCTKLSSILFPLSLIKIGSLRSCESLKAIQLPENLIEMGCEQAFYGCKSAEIIEIPDGITKICHSAFQGCRSLRTLILPSKVTGIGDRAFWGCEILAEVRCTTAIPPSLYESTFGGEKDMSGRIFFYPTGSCPDLSKVTLRVPKGSVEAYSNHPIWGQFGNIVEL